MKKKELCWTEHRESNSQKKCIDLVSFQLHCKATYAALVTNLRKIIFRNRCSNSFHKRLVLLQILVLTFPHVSNLFYLRKSICSYALFLTEDLLDSVVSVRSVCALCQLYGVTINNYLRLDIYFKKILKDKLTSLIIFEVQMFPPYNGILADKSHKRNKASYIQETRNSQVCFIVSHDYIYHDSHFF